MECGSLLLAPNWCADEMSKLQVGAAASYRTPWRLGEGLVITIPIPRAASDKRLTARPH